MIEINNLCKSYGDKIIFDNFNAIIYEGKKNILVGQSGRGKTSLIRILLGLEEYEGKIIGLTGKTLSVVFQENRLLENNTVFENFRFIYGEKVNRELLETHLNSVGLKGILNKKVKTLSGGMKRRVSIVRGLYLDRDIYILDEPFKEIDEINYLNILKYFEDRSRGKTVILASHNSKEIARYGENIIYINEVSSNE